MVSYVVAIASTAWVDPEGDRCVKLCRHKYTFFFIKPLNIYSEKTIEGYLDSVPSLTSNTIKTLLIMNSFHSSRYLQSNWMLYFSHASMVKVQCKAKWCNPLY